MSKIPDNTNNVKNAANTVKNAAKNTMNAMKGAMDSVMSGNCYLIVVYLVCIIFLVIFSYSVYLKREFSKAGRNRDEMEKVRLSDSGEYMGLKPLDDADYNKEGDYGKGTYFALIDYHIKGSYNSCSTGPAVNGWVDPLALKSVITRGVRFLDFEIYLKKNQAVVALQKQPYPSGAKPSKCTTCNYKDSLNELNILNVLELVKREAIESGNCRNNTDPLILSFRIMSENDNVYSILAHSIKKTFSNYLLPAKYGYCGTVKASGSGNKKYSGNGKSIFQNSVLYADLIHLKNKVVIFAKGPPNNPQSYKNNRKFYELMNGGDEDSMLNYKSDYRIMNDSETFNVEEHKYNYCISYPDMTSKNNSTASVHFKRGCQAILMNFGTGYNDTEMKYYKERFSNEQRAFILKPKNLRRKRLFGKKAQPQDPALNPIQRECVIDGSNFGFEGEMQMGNIGMAPDMCK